MPDDNKKWPPDVINTVIKVMEDLRTRAIDIANMDVFGYGYGHAPEHAYVQTAPLPGGRSYEKGDDVTLAWYDHEGDENSVNVRIAYFEMTDEQIKEDVARRHRELEERREARRREDLIKQHGANREKFKDLVTALMRNFPGVVEEALAEREGGADDTAEVASHA